MLKKFTVFGQGFVGKNLSTFLKERKCSIFLPKKRKFKFKKNLNHVVFCIGNQNWLDDVELTYEANLAMLAKILFNNKFKSFTLVSSTRLYMSNFNKRTSEKSSIQVDTSKKSFLYNSLKIAAENLCLSLDNKNIRVARISNLFASNFTNQAYILPTMIKDSIKKKRINLQIGKNSTKDFIHVEDAFNVLFKVIIRGKYRIYNIANGKNIKIGEIVKKIKRKTNCSIAITKYPKIIKEPKININRIKKEFNFKTKYNLLNMIDKIIENQKNLY